MPRGAALLDLHEKAGNTQSTLDDQDGNDLEISLAGGGRIVRGVGMRSVREMGSRRLDKVGLHSSDAGGVESRDGRAGWPALASSPSPGMRNDGSRWT